MSVQIDYTTITVISVLSGFGGPVGTELAKAVIASVKERVKHVGS